MTQYLLSVHGSEADEMPAEDEMQRMFKAVDDFNDKVKSAGAWVFAGGLEPVATATTVDGTGTGSGAAGSGSGVIVTDGPYAESKEYLGGFWIIDVADLDEALKWAAEGSAACVGKVEVRPFQSDAG